MNRSYSRSFLKWPGGKYRLLPHILPVLPKCQVLVEPFVGSGVVFLNTEYDAYQINDVNQDLIGVYRAIQTEGKAFIEYARSFFSSRYNNATQYYAFREAFNGSASDAENLHRSALFLYLNRHGYNGLCRYNRRGGFNVPFGRYRRPYFPEEELMKTEQKMNRVFLSALDYHSFLNQIPAGSAIYCDPPYAPLKGKASVFTSYAAQCFGSDQQVHLAQTIQTLAQKGFHVLVSNHDTPWTRQLYKGAQFKPIVVRRHISCQARLNVPEILAYFAPQYRIPKGCKTKSNPS